MVKGKSSAHRGTSEHITQQNRGGWHSGLAFCSSQKGAEQPGQRWKRSGLAGDRVTEGREEKGFKFLCLSHVAMSMSLSCS